ncbi:MAG TPA: MarR family transcriptional regulator [Actinomycetota bacterium]|jgi:DNA-binding MarR family transcriptional regulator|nr:MarR family transcriptional regulator [Actinomycetota bacterium]
MTMRASGNAGPGRAGRRRSRAELVKGILERDRDTLALSVQLDRATPGAAQPDLTMRQLLALYLLLEAPRRVGELARQLNVTISSASGLVDRLVGAGLVEREHGTADRRLVVCRLSDQGRRELEAFLQLGRLRLERVLARLSAQDLLVVQRALDLLIAAARDAIAEQRAT